MPLILFLQHDIIFLSLIHICYFYEYQAPEAVEDIVARITALEQDISAGLAELFHKNN